jgi:lipoyl(octanoyl) transferase
MSNAWRIIDTGSCSAAYNMALDESIAIAVRQDISPPTLRIYGWDQPSVSIGCFQRSGNLDLGYCRENDILIVRRLTGGRAVLHNDEITYSFSVKTQTGLFSKGLLDSYKKISTALALALSKVGLSPQSKIHKTNPKSKIQNSNLHNPLCFQSISYGEVSVNNIKVIGSAQKRWADGLLQQGSIPFTVNEDELLKLFQPNSVQTRKEPLIGLKQIAPGLSHDEIKNAIRISFEETFQVALIHSSPSQEESSLAQELESQKYLSDAWTFRR